jgi:S1-C subfamily serine protease
MFKTAVTIGAVMVATLAGAEEWTPKQMNKEIEQTNFIIGSHCSATLVDIKERLLLTNHHCIAQYVLKKTRAVTQDDGSITNKQFEVLKPVPTSQKTYRGHDLVGQATYMGEIVGMEEDNDLALVQLRAENIPHTMEAEIFNGTQLYRGETVFAVGNPRGLDLTVSKGVISSTNRL